MCGQYRLLHQDHDMGLAGSVGQVHMQYLVPEGLGGDHPRRNMDLCGRNSSSMDVLHAERVGMAVGSIDHDAAGGLWHSLAGSCGSGREGNVVRIPRCGHTSY